MSDELPVDRLLGVDGIEKWFIDRGFPMTKSGVYRLGPEGWPVFKIRGKITARACSLQRHLEVLEAKAEIEARKKPKPSRRARAA